VCCQPALSTHWILIDPLLMLSTASAAWAVWELLARRDDSAPRRLALILALWIKGLIGPAAVAGGIDRGAGRYTFAAGMGAGAG
jgi:hypothetical protein